MIAISYRRDDSLPVAGRLYDRLQARFGKPNIFMDFDSIRPGLDFRDQIRETIERSELVIALIGPQWLGQVPDSSRRVDDPNDFVRLEIAHALKRDIPIVPVLINNTPMPKAEMLPEDMRGLVYRHALPLDSGLDFHQHADRLIAGVCDLVGGSSVRLPDNQETASRSDSPRAGSRFTTGLLAAILVAVAGIGCWLFLARPVLKKTGTSSGPSAQPAVVETATSLGAAEPRVAKVSKPALELSSQPAGARVLNNGMIVGVTPLHRDDVEAGVSKFVLMAEGYLPREVEVKIDPQHGFKRDVSLARPAPLYVGAVRVRDHDGRESEPSRPITIELASDLASGTMTQGTKRGDFVVRFTGIWAGPELRAVTGGVVAQPPGIQWTPESFTLQFSEDGMQANYECVAGGKTYGASLAGQSELSAQP